MAGRFVFHTFSLSLHLGVDFSRVFLVCTFFPTGSTRSSGPHRLSRTTRSQGKEGTEVVSMVLLVQLEFSSLCWRWTLPVGTDAPPGHFGPPQ